MLLGAGVAVGCSSGGAADGGPGDGADAGDGMDGGDGVPNACDLPLVPTEEDRDGDGIPDEVEDPNENGTVDFGETDPLDPDTDGDGLIDGLEDGNHNGQVSWGETDPRQVDSDGDGLADGLEDRNCSGEVEPGETDPLKPDSDRDGLADGLEDANHNGQLDPGETDPTRTDSDQDGLADGVEDANHNGVVDVGETDPTQPDMDGDGVLDGDEDRDGDGRMGDCTLPCASSAECAAGEVCAVRARVCYSPACSRGESDPFDPDTDGDGIGDGQEASTLACAADSLKPIEFAASESADFRLALEPHFDRYTTLLDGADEVGVMFHASAFDLAGFSLVRAPGAASASGQEALDRALLAGQAMVEAASARALTTFDGFPAVVAEYDLVAAAALTAPELANALVIALRGSPGLTGLLQPLGSGSTRFRLTTETVYRSASRVLLVASLAPTASLIGDQLFRLTDVTNSTALGGFTDQVDVQCDAFLSKGLDPVDFIWVVDNSGSMGEEQQAVSAAANAMASLLATTTLDWRIGVTNTDAVWGGALWSGFIRDIARFREDVQQGTGGSPIERSLAMGLAAIDRSLPCTPAGSEDRYKLRCGATRVVILLTDEDDETIEEQSGGDDYPGDPDAATVAGFVQDYRGRGVVLMAIAGGNPMCQSALNASKGIDAVVQGVGSGSTGSICELDQTANVEQIIRVAFGVSSTYHLSQPPISATIQVAQVRQALGSPQLVPRSRADGFDFDGVTNSLVFYGNSRPSVDDLDVVASYRRFIDCQPQPEECNGMDDDCDSLTDEDFDQDSDGYSACGLDCDDGDAAIHPGAEERCNGLDDDCDGETDEGFDGDGDGFRTCDDDCDDSDPAVFPGAPELCDGLDNDCDGEIDPEWACG